MDPLVQKYSRERRRVWELRKQLRRLNRLHYLWQVQNKFERDQAHKWRDMFHAELKKPAPRPAHYYDTFIGVVIAFVVGLLLGPGLLWVIR